MKKIESRPYKILGKILNYDWGTKNENAFIPKLLGNEIKEDLPYAEYWIGVHPKAPSEILVNNEKISFIDLLKENSTEILGERIAKKFNNTLPFLLKILSINHALSIQAHPDKNLARILNKNDPEHYPDENHKPEIAIAIDKLEAIVGLKSGTNILQALNSYSEIEILLSEYTLEKVDQGQILSNNGIVNELYSDIMNSSEENLSRCVMALLAKFKAQQKLNQAENQFLIQYETYGIDIGLISILLFNYLNLKKGEAIFTPAGVPHAYISGNIIECMANSDNVVRAGLTPKFKDIDTLTNMLEIDQGRNLVDVLETSDKIVYKTSAEEFEIELLKLSGEYSITQNDELNLLFVIEGNISIHWNDNLMEYKNGDVILLPANLRSFTILGNIESMVLNVKVP